MLPAIFRVDGSSHLGMGHVMRCLALAGGLAQRGVNSQFIVKEFEARVTELIRAHGFDVEVIPTDVRAEEDARLTRVTALRHGANLIVTDLCNRPALGNRPELDLYHRLLGNEFATVCLSGGDAIDVPAAIVVYPYYRTSLPNLIDEGKGVRLIGPAYFIFRPEFTQAALADRPIATVASRILVLIGGADEYHLTTKTARAICALPQPGLSIRIVIGPAFPKELIHEITDLLGGFKGDWGLLESGTNLAEAMLWADLAITGDGLTKYETAVTGTPSLMLSRPDSEAQINHEFEQAGSTRHLGDGTAISVGELVEKIELAIENQNLRQRMSQRGKAIVDGKGIERILAALPTGLISGSRLIYP